MDVKMDWRCSNCTTKNKHGISKCKSCSAERPPSSLEEMFELQSLIVWQCIKCHTSNNGNRVKCQKCNAVGTWCEESGLDQDRLVAEASNRPDCTNSPHSDNTPTTGDLSHDASIDMCTANSSSSNYDIADTSSEEAPPGTGTEHLSELRIVLLGKTGEGKSASGNTILGTVVFDSTLSPISITKKCQRGTCTRFGRIIQIIDTPGMFDTEMSTADITKEVIRCVGMTAPGPHVFLLVLTPGRHTEEAQNTVDHFMKIFGDGMLKHLIVLFTKKDDLAHNGETIEDYLKKDSGKLQALLASCQNRYLAFNNRGSPSEKEEDVKKLLGLVDEIVKENKGVYTSEMFEHAEKIMKEKEAKLNREHQEELERQRNRIREECDIKLQASEKEHEEITQQLQIRLADLEDQTTEKSREESSNLSKQLREMRAQHREEMRRIREIGDGKMTSLKYQKVNHRDKAREEINDDSSFVKDTLVPGLFEVAKVAIPAIIDIIKLILKK